MNAITRILRWLFGEPVSAIGHKDTRPASHESKTSDNTELCLSVNEDGQLGIVWSTGRVGGLIALIEPPMFFTRRQSMDLARWIIKSQRGTEITKTTVLDGYYASGDCECFCFDKRTHDAAMAEARNALRNNTEPDAEHIDPHKGKRVYPDDLLPETGGRKGRWTITVSFTPEPEPTP